MTIKFLPLLKAWHSSIPWLIPPVWSIHSLFPYRPPLRPTEFRLRRYTRRPACSPEAKFIYSTPSTTVPTRIAACAGTTHRSRIGASNLKSIMVP